MADTNAARKRNVAAGLCMCGDERRPERKTCAACAKKANESSKRKRLNPSYYKRVIAWNKAGYHRLKDSIFKAYGGAFCACCGDANREFLTIDHIKPVGMRRDFNRCGVGLFRWLKKNNYPSGFRVLCMNCNFSLGHFGYCPHKEKSKILLIVPKRMESSHDV